MSLFSKVFTLFFRIVALIFVALLLPSTVKAQEATEHTKEGFDPSEVIISHVTDAHIWHFWEGHHGTLYLPVIVHTEEKGWDFFSARNLYDEAHQPVEYAGYIIKNNHVFLAASGKEVLDFSITKTVIMLFLNGALMFLVFIAVARGYSKNRGKAPGGVQSFFEPIILLIRDDIVKPNIGKHYEKYLPYMLSLFFFILFGNLLGLLPGAANLTGNIAITMTLAVLTFVITNFSGNKHYWSHVFWTPGVPFLLRFIILPVEIIGLFTKPFALMIRLFAAITAGHIVLLSLLCLAFIFKNFAVGAASSLLVIFISLIELVVAVIQAYVFVMFSSLYIGMAVEQHDEILVS